MKSEKLHIFCSKRKDNGIMKANLFCSSGSVALLTEKDVVLTAVFYLLRAEFKLIIGKW